MNSDIDKAVQILNSGGIIIFPTDTAFGIGCRIDRIDAIERLFNLRQRPIRMATPVLVSSIEMAKKYWESLEANVEEKLIKKYWPGALTIVLKARKDLVPSLVRGGGGNIGIRMPNDKQILEIIEKTGVPILGPSANIHGEQTPYSKNMLNKYLVQSVDFVLEGECSIKNASTVVDCTKTPWQILRKGAVELKI
ncbi:MAG: threonylcarbamoyl-AMP synthase [Candidatus Levybacteria bacterium]|nr:threonylcarbamoyl-AMP synthase [Candidatus Levybacteria bacterium]